MSHGRQPEVECFLFWRSFAPYHGEEKLLVDDSIMRTRILFWLDVTSAMTLKGSKKGKIQFPVAVRGSKTSVLKLPIITLLNCFTSYRDVAV